jgi:predicted nucleotidyltransferase
MRPTVQKILIELKSILQAMYGDRLSRVILYGSQARLRCKMAERWSDIDVLVVLKDADVDLFRERRKFSHQRAQWNLDYQELLSLLFFTERDFEEKTGLF